MTNFLLGGLHLWRAITWDWNVRSQHCQRDTCSTDCRLQIAVQHKICLSVAIYWQNTTFLFPQSNIMCDQNVDLFDVISSRIRRMVFRLLGRIGVAKSAVKMRFLSRLSLSLSQKDMLSFWWILGLWGCWWCVYDLVPVFDFVGKDLLCSLYFDLHWENLYVY